MPAKKVWDYGLQKEGDENVIVVNCLGSPIGSSIEESDEAMARVIDILLEEEDASRVVLAEAYENEYGPTQTRMLPPKTSLLGPQRSARSPITGARRPISRPRSEAASEIWA